MAFIKYLPLLLLCSAANAQSFGFSDLFGQASKQKDYYLQQIAAYNALRAELKQGYNLLQHGLDGIGDINTAELNAHATYYTSLQTPSVSVKSNNQVKDILNYQSDICKAFSQSFTGLTPDETSYVQNVKTTLLNDCNKDLTDLQNLLSTGKLQLSDNERLKRLNALHDAMLDKYGFCQSFTNAIKQLVMHRQQRTADMQTLTALYENN